MKEDKQIANPFERERKAKEAKRQALLQKAKSRVGKTTPLPSGKAGKNPFDPFDRKGKKVKDPDAPKSKEEANLRNVRTALYRDPKFLKIAAKYARKDPSTLLKALTKYGWDPSGLKDPATGAPMEASAFKSYWGSLLMRGGLTEVLGADDPSSGVHNKQRWAKKFVDDWNTLLSDMKAIQKFKPGDKNEKMKGPSADSQMVDKIFAMMAKVDPETIARQSFDPNWAHQDDTEGYFDEPEDAQGKKPLKGKLGENMLKHIIKNRLMEAMGHKPKTIQERLKEIARKAIAEVYNVEEAPRHRERYQPSSKRPSRSMGSQYDPDAADRDARASAERMGFMTSPTGGASGEGVPMKGRPEGRPRHRGHAERGRLSSSEVQSSYDDAQSEYEDDLAQDIGGTREPVDSYVHDPEVQDWLRKAGLSEPTRGKRVGQPTTSRDVEDFFRG